MLPTFKHFWLCFFGPRLYKIHGDGAYDKLYSPSNMEIWSDQVIKLMNLVWKIGIYTSPLVGIYLYRRDYMEMKLLISVLKIVAGLGVSSLCLRGYGRAMNPQYTNFIRILDTAQHNTSADPSFVRKFDFDFNAWPVDFDCQSVENTKRIVFNTITNRGPIPIKDIPMFIIGEIAMRTFALKLIYPGSIYLLHSTFLYKFLLEGRVKLVEEYNGKRYKLRTRDNNMLDCMFVDRRNQTTNGSTLVITSEGNGGYYEIGIMQTPIDGGYSVLGWNRPGFACSTGQPIPSQEHNAIDTVIQFATKKLGFTLDNIIFYGWSIGGYPVAWAAMHYPEIKGIVLDATFDDLLPLALAKMPPSLNSLVTEVIRYHVDLNIAQLLRDYPGPIKVVRRTLDEIICVDEGRLSTNRGNDLLIDILKHRYPQVCGPQQVELLQKYLGLLGPALAVFKSKEHPGDQDKNKKVMFLAEKYLVDYQSTHCVPLPADYFQLPREITLDEDFVYT